MKTIFDLRETRNVDFYKALEAFYDGENIKVLSLGDAVINACLGCWSCWLKTPGRCVIKDQMSESYFDYVNSDTVVLLMDTAQGFINHRAKAFLDRTIPHYHPYIELVNWECHHEARYDRYPDMVFYFENKGLSDREEQVIEDHLCRSAYHFKSKAYRLIDNDELELIELNPREAKRGAVPFAGVEPMDKLVIYGGSPRIRRSNTDLILKKVVEALSEKVEVRDLKQRENWEDWAKSFESDKNVLFFMPLYVHAMPSHVMQFIEKLSASQGSIGFFVQSGFPESSQSYYLEAYFEQLALRLGRAYTGTAIKGGVESLQFRPEQGRDKMMEPMVKVIENLIDKGQFDPHDIKRLSRPVRMGKAVGLVFNLLSKFGVVNSMMWDGLLKKNGAYEKSRDRPYN